MNRYYIVFVGCLMLSCTLVAMKEDPSKQGAKRSFDQIAAQEQLSESSESFSWRDESSDSDSESIVELSEEKQALYEALCRIAASRFSLEEAVVANNSEEVKLLLEQGANCNTRGTGNKTLLMIALEKGYKDIAKLLLAHPGFIINPYDSDNARGMPTLGYAIEQGYEDIVDTILERFPDYYDPARYPMLSNGLAYAVILDKPHFVHKFLTLGANPHITMQSVEVGLLDYAFQRGISSETILVLLEKLGVYNVNRNHINYIVSSGNLKALSFIFGQHKFISAAPFTMRLNTIDLESYENSLNVDPTSDQFLSCIKQREAIHGLQSFMNNKKELSPPSIHTLNDECMNVFKRTPQHLRDEHTGQTALMRCCLTGYTMGVLSLLHLPQWYINAQDKWGKTALMYTILYDYDECVNVLINLPDAANPGKRTNKCGSGINLKDNDGNTALFYALALSKFEIAKLLMAQGAKIGSTSKVALLLKKAATTGNLRSLLLLLGKYSQEFIEVAKKLEIIKAVHADTHPNIQILNPEFSQQNGVRFFE